MWPDSHASPGRSVMVRSGLRTSRRKEHTFWVRVAYKPRTMIGRTICQTIFLVLSLAVNPAAIRMVDIVCAATCGQGSIRVISLFIVV